MAEPNKGGRPKFVPTDNQRIEVQALIACGVSVETIGIYLRLDPRTVQRAFKHEVATGRQFMNAALVGRLMQLALKGNFHAIAFVLTRRFGWKETSRTELTGIDGKPISFANVPDDQLAQLAAALLQGIPVGPDQGGADQAHIDRAEAGGDSLGTDAGTTDRGTDD